MAPTNIPTGIIILKAITCVRLAHIGMRRNNIPTTVRQTRGAVKKSDVAKRLLQIHAIRMRMKQVSPLTTKHLPRERNQLGDMFSRLFGYNANRHHKNNLNVLTLFDKSFLLLSQNS